VIYARASALGCEGPEAERAAPGYTAHWSRGALATTFQLIDHSLTEPPREPVAGFGERPAAAILAGGIAAAIFRRAVSGEAAEVDLSLLGFAAFNLSMDVVSTAGGGATTTGTRLLPPDRFNVLNPFTNFYRTRDGRFIALCVLQERFFRDVCVTLGIPDVIDDVRFSTAAARVENARYLVPRLDEVFATRTLAEWAAYLADVEWVWEPVQTAAELLVDPQIVANGAVSRADGQVAVAGPVQFDERPPELRICNREMPAGDLLADRRKS
jgi:crotonobetainyl-CoA:carnitine CoA-transferase CaiB-like acyl-CoA transferase